MKTKPFWPIALCLLIWLVIDAIEPGLPCITLPGLASTILMYDIELELTQLAQEQSQKMADIPMEENPSSPFPPQIEHLNLGRLQRPTPDAMPDWDKAQFLDLRPAH